MPPPVAPSRRMAYDATGDVLFADNFADPGPTDITTVYGPVLNDEATDSFDLEAAWPADQPGTFGVLFSEPKDIYGFFFSAFDNDGINPGGVGDVETSTDTTNGRDGTWTVAISSYPTYEPMADYRDNIESFLVTAVVGIRVNVTNKGPFPGSANVYGLHVYGVPGAGSDPDRLGFLDPIAEYTTVKDYGDQGFGAEIKTLMAIKNKSATLTAQTITLTREGLSGDSKNWYEFSIDDTTYATSLAIGNIVPGGTTQFWLRQQIPPTGILGLQSARILADAVGGWI